MTLTVHMRSSLLTSLWERILGKFVIFLMLASVCERASSSVPFFGYMIYSVVSSALLTIVELGDSV